MIKFLAYFNNIYGPLRILESITLRAIIGVSIGFIVALIFGKYFIGCMLRRSATEDVEKPDSETLNRLHSGKKGTPTMGGVIVIVAMFTAIIITCDPTEPLVLLGLGILGSFGVLGFIDDYMKLKKIGKGGLGKKQKLICQILLAGLASIGLWLCANNNHFKTYNIKEIKAENGEATPTVRKRHLVENGATSLLVPFTKFEDTSPNLGWLYYVFFTFVIVACSNAVNLTDGLDGLASGCTIMVAVTYSILAYVVGNSVMCAWFRIPWVPGAGELAIICAIIIGSVMGFLWFNSHPAQVFMGDTGSLAIGALIAYISLIIKHELVLIVAGGIFVIEATSVLIQMTVFKWTGKRVFKCAPFHHHLEFCGWHENKVVVRMWMVGGVLAAISLATLKMH